MGVPSISCSVMQQASMRAPEARYRGPNPRGAIPTSGWYDNGSLSNSRFESPSSPHQLEKNNHDSTIKQTSINDVVPISDHGGKYQRISGYPGSRTPVLQLRLVHRPCSTRLASSTAIQGQVGVIVRRAIDTGPSNEWQQRRTNIISRLVHEKLEIFKNID